MTRLLDDGIVVVEVRKGVSAMETAFVPPALRARLGDEATLGLLELLETTNRAWRDDLLEIATERFERRLSEELGALRIEMVNGFAAIRQEMAAMRFDLIKWSFLFWIGQVATLGGLIAFMLKNFAVR